MIASLFSPVNIAGREFKNRAIASPPPSLLAEPDGRVSPQLMEYYQNLADTDVSVVIVEAAAISSEAVAWAKHLSIASTDMITGLSRLVEKIRNKGALPVAQLYHGGINASAGRNHTVSGPSTIAHRKITARISGMTTDKIRQTIDCYAAAATTAWNAGFSGIEIQAADGSLIQQFLSPLTNKREDTYAIGENEGSLLLMEVVRAVKQTVPDLLISIKLSLKDLVPGGKSLLSTIRTARMLKNDGIDLIHVTEGLTIGNPLLLHPSLGKTAADAPFSEDTHIFRQETGMTVILSGKISTPEVANTRLRKSAADFVSLGRTLNREPSWLRVSRIDDSIIPWQKCLRCSLCQAASEGCPDRHGVNRWLIR